MEQLPFGNTKAFVDLQCVDREFPHIVLDVSTSVPEERSRAKWKRNFFIRAFHPAGVLKKIHSNSLFTIFIVSVRAGAKFRLVGRLYCVKKLFVMWNKDSPMES